MKVTTDSCANTSDVTGGPQQSCLKKLSNHTSTNGTAEVARASPGYPDWPAASAHRYLYGPKGCNTSSAAGVLRCRNCLPRAARRFVLPLELAQCMKVFFSVQR
jgi:hypothetical protein